MKKLSIVLILCWVLGLMLGLWTVSVQAQEYHYRYVSLDEVESPPGFLPGISPELIDNAGRIYGTVYDESFLPHIGIYAKGAVTVLQPPAYVDAISNGIIAARLLVDPSVNLKTQPALFRGNHMELIPTPPDSYFYFVIGLTPSGTALVESHSVVTGSFQQTYFLYRDGQLTQLNFGPTIWNPIATDMNNQGIICGYGYFHPSGNIGGFRFNPRTGELTLLNPLPTEMLFPAPGDLDINNRGEVLGVSVPFAFEFTSIQHIGVWDHKGDFKTYFVNDLTAYRRRPRSYDLLFNDNNLIIITRVGWPLSEFGNSYIVPEPGVRLNLADLVENLPSGVGPPQYYPPLSNIIGVNNHGDMIGFGEDFPRNIFLLERIGNH